MATVSKSVYHPVRQHGLAEGLAASICFVKPARHTLHTSATLLSAHTAHNWTVFNHSSLSNQACSFLSSVRTVSRRLSQSSAAERQRGIPHKRLETYSRIHHEAHVGTVNYDGRSEEIYRKKDSCSHENAADLGPGSAVSRRSLLGSATLSAAASVALSSHPPLSVAETLSAGPASLLVNSGLQTGTTGFEPAQKQPGQLASLPALPPGSTVTLAILGECGLGVSVYPDFSYNPLGGGGLATAIDNGDGRIAVRFDPATVIIPAVEGSTTTLIGVPLPPPLRIDIVPQALEGFIDRATGQVDLTFKAKFFFSAGPLYRPPALLVDTVLTTEFSKGESRSGHGERLDAQGKCLLVGTARVPPINDAFLDNFLMLPTDVLAVLPAQFSFTPASAPQPSTNLETIMETASKNGQYDLVHKMMM